MKRDEYLRELATAGDEMSERARELAVAVNPVNQFRASVARDWRWWLPAALVAGFAAAQLLRAPRTGKGGARDGGGAAFWVPTLLKLLPGVAAQVIPLFVSMRSNRKM